VATGRIRCDYFALGVCDDPLAVDYVCCGGGVVGLLAVASEDWDWADAWGCDFAVVWKGVSVSVYVDVGAFYGFVDCCSGFVGGGLGGAWLLVWVFGLSL
jgi:hypothetical protein